MVCRGYDFLWQSEFTQLTKFDFQAMIGSVQQNPQAPKPRAGMEIPANIQPKAPNMRPPLLPSNPTQIRPGSSVSTQTAGQQLAPGPIVPPRPQVS